MPSLRLVPYGPPAVFALRDALVEAKGDDPLAPVTVAVPAAIQGEEKVTSTGSVNNVPSLRTKFTVMLVLPPAEMLGTAIPMMPA